MIELVFSKPLFRVKRFIAVLALMWFFTRVESRKKMGEKVY